MTVGEGTGITGWGASESGTPVEARLWTRKPSYTPATGWIASM